jgi:hypothetical protein
MKTKVGKDRQKVHTHGRINELSVLDKDNMKDTGALREDRFMESYFNRMTRKIVSSPSQTIVNMPDLYYTSLEPSKPANTPSELEDNFL